VVLGSIGDLYRDRLRFVLDVARTATSRSIASRT
jgi:hypothetical protein